MGCNSSKSTETSNQNKPEEKPAEEGKAGEQPAENGGGEATKEADTGDGAES